MEYNIDPQALENATKLIDFYRPLFKSTVTDYEKSKTKFFIPVCPPNVLISLCEAAKNIFMNDPMLLRFNNEGDQIAIVGDLHGHILDLFRTLGKVGMPPDRTYLFLGDIVDRGEFSTETITIILALKVMFPKNVYIIRGNHEFREMGLQFGFCNELNNLYKGNTLVEESFMEAFSYIPIAAMIGNHSLCVHGGIGPTLYTIDQLDLIERPLNSYTDDMVAALLWSDPSRFGKDFEPSTRGLGYFFGPEALTYFLEKNNLKYVIRGHECVENGIEMQLGRKMITVFGASNYCGLSPNKSGVLILKPNDPNFREAIFFQPISHPKRSIAVFLPSENHKTFSIRRPGSFSVASRPPLNKLPQLNDRSKLGMKISPRPIPTNRKGSVSAQGIDEKQRLLVRKIPNIAPKRMSSCPSSRRLSQK